MADVIILLRAGGEAYADLVAPMLGTRPPVFASADAIRGEAAQARVILGMPYLINQALLDRMPRLEWLNLLSAGVDPLLPLKLDPAIKVTTTRGCHPHVAEHILMLMLALSRQLRTLIAAQDERRWAPLTSTPLIGQHLVILGVGAIAELVAARAQAFGMRATGVSSRAAAPGFDAMTPVEQLIEVARTADWLVPLSPYSPATHHIVGREVIAALPATARIVNAGRGRLIDEAALAEALAAGRIAGAGLDVFETEPLPEDSPLWGLPNVLLTPHAAGFTSNFPELVTPLLTENFERWSRGETLLNLTAVS